MASKVFAAMAVALVCLPLTACGRGGTPASPPTTSGAPAPSASTGGGSPTTAPTGGPSGGAPSTTPATPFPESLRGQDIERIPALSRVVALTFDAGANADAVPSILATLAREQIRATFFLTGDFVASFPEQSRRIAAAGERLGNHSVSHPYFTQLTDAQIRAQLSQAAASIQATTGANPAPWFRFPFGDRNARTIAAVNAAGYVPVRWTVDTLGWQGTQGGARGASFVTARVLAAASPGEIVLMHVGSNPDDHSTLDADALPTVISELRARGYGFVTLDAALG